MMAWWSGDMEAFQRWFDAAERKGQHWQGDTGSVCGSLFTPLQAVIICYDLMSVVWPVMGNINPCTSSLACKSRSGEKKVLMFWRRIYATPKTGWSNFGTLDQFPGDYVHKTEFTGIDQNERLNREAQHQNTTRPCHSTHEFQLFSRLGGNKFFHLFHVKIFMSADIYQSEFLNYCPFWAFFDLRLTVIRILHKYSSLHPFNRLFGISQ